MKGRKPKPTALKLLAGNPGHNVPKHEAKPARGIPKPPAHLAGAALTGWMGFGPWLCKSGLLTMLDAAALEQLCENYGELLELRDDIRLNGRFTAGDGGKMQRTRPQHYALQDAERRFRAMLCEFGMTPSSRARATATPQDDDKGDKANEYFG